MRLLLVLVVVLATAGPAQALPSARVSPLRTGFLDIAHRGASGLAPEHTIAAYDLALGLGADVIELDVGMTRDGHLVVVHDETLDRTTDCSGPPQLKTLAEIKRCDAGSWFNAAHPDLARPEYAGQKVPTLDEVLRRYGDSVNYYVETKIFEDGGNLERKTIELLRAHGLVEPAARDRQVFLQSFLPEHILRMRIFEPRIPRVFLLQGTLAAINPLQIAFAGATAQGVGPAHGTVDAAFVAQAHAAGLQIHPYTVDEPKRIGELQRLGVDGTFTNRPDRFEDWRGLFAAGSATAARGRVTGLWRLPADALAGGPAAGAALAGVPIAGRPAPLPGQPVAGISAVVPDGPRRFLVLPDDQWDTPNRAADVQARVYAVRVAGGRVTVRRTVVLRRPDGTPLTGAQIDPEALARTRDGVLWVGEERGPSVLRFGADGRQLGEPIRFAGLSTPFSAGAGAGNPLAVRPVGAVPAATLLPGRGIQGLALTHDGRRVLALVAGPVAGEADPRTRLILELDARRAQPTGRRWRFRVGAPGHVASDLVAAGRGTVLVLDRDTRAARDARHKRILRVDLRRAPVGGHARVSTYMDLLALRDERGRPWSLPFAEIDALAAVGDDVLVVNDNDLPFGSARAPGRPDDTEFTRLRRLRGR